MNKAWVEMCESSESDSSESTGLTSRPQGHVEVPNSVEDIVTQLASLAPRDLYVIEAVNVHPQADEAELRKAIDGNPVRAYLAAGVWILEFNSLEQATMAASNAIITVRGESVRLRLSTSMKQSFGHGQRFERGRRPKDSRNRNRREWRNQGERRDVAQREQHRPPPRTQQGQHEFNKEPEEMIDRQNTELAAHPPQPPQISKEKDSKSPNEVQSTPAAEPVKHFFNSKGVKNEFLKRSKNEPSIASFETKSSTEATQPTQSQLGASGVSSTYSIASLPGTQTTVKPATPVLKTSEAVDNTPQLPQRFPKSTNFNTSQNQGVLVQRKLIDHKEEEVIQPSTGSKAASLSDVNQNSHNEAKKERALQPQSKAHGKKTAKFKSKPQSANDIIYVVKNSDKKS